MSDVVIIPRGRNLGQSLYHLRPQVDLENSIVYHPACYVFSLTDYNTAFHDLYHSPRHEYAECGAGYAGHIRDRAFSVTEMKHLTSFLLCVAFDQKTRTYGTHYVYFKIEPLEELL